MMLPSGWLHMMINHIPLCRACSGTEKWGVRYCESPTWLKLSQQVSRDVRGSAPWGKSEAGRNKNTGCVIEPRKMYSCGHWIAIEKQWSSKKPWILRWSSFAFEPRPPLVHFSTFLSVNSECSSQSRSIRLRPVAPKRSVTTEPSLILPVSNSLWTRLL